MLQERNDNRAARATDLLLAAGLILLVLLARLVMAAAALHAWRGATQMALFLVFVTAGGLFYKKRLVSYRYTLFYSEPGAVQYPLPAGTLLLEQMLGDRVQTTQVVLAKEMIALLAPDGPGSIALIGGEGAKPPKLRRLALTTGPKRKAHSLILRQQGSYLRLYFTPSGEMARRLGDMIAAGRRL